MFPERKFWTPPILFSTTFKVLIFFFKTSGLITRLTTDVSHVSWAFQTVIRVAVRSPLTIIFSLIMIIKISKKMALIFVGIMPVMAIGLLLIIKYAHPLFRKVFDEYDHMNNVVSENLNGIRVVKSFANENIEEKKFKKGNEKFLEIKSIVSDPMMELEWF